MMKKAFDVYKELVIAKKKRGEFHGRRMSERQFNKKNFGGLPTKKQDRELKRYLQYSMEYDKREARIKRKGYEMNETKLREHEFATYYEAAKNDLKKLGSHRDPMKVILSKQQYKITAKAARKFMESIPQMEEQFGEDYESATFEKIRLGDIDTEHLRQLYHTLRESNPELSSKEVQRMIGNQIFGSP